MRYTNEERQKLIDDPGLPWKKWFRYVLFKYWYAFFCLLIDLGIPIQYIENYELIGNSGYWPMIASLVSVPFLITVEALLYKKLFPKEF